MRRWIANSLRVAVVIGPFGVAGCHSAKHTMNCPDEACTPIMAEPSVCSEPSMMALARDLDHLEKHIEWYGSATPKAPDVWGQARLTQHRKDFEDQFKGDVSAFSVKLNASLSRTDQAYLAYAETLGLAVAAPSRGATNSATSGDKSSLETTDRTTVTTVEDKSKDKVTQTTETTDTAKPASSPPELTAATVEKKPSELVNLAKDGIIHRTSETSTKKIGFGADGVALEPTLELAQKKRYLDFLNQLRRENEGDDTADSPGYSLNLVRIPVSLLPGSRTDMGHAREVTMSLNPILGDDLLATTFRNFVINDLVQQLSFPLTTFLEGESYAETEERFLTKEIQKSLQINEAELPRSVASANPKPTAIRLVGGQDPAVPALTPTATPTTAWKAQYSKKLDQAINRPDRSKGTPNRTGTVTPLTAMALSADAAKVPVANAPVRTTTESDLKKFAAKQIVRPTLSFSNGTTARQPFPISQILDIYGVRYSFEIGLGAQEAMENEIEFTGYVHLPDVQSYLREEIRAAYQFLSQPETECLWTEFCTETLVRSIRTQRWDDVQEIRRCYQEKVRDITGSKTPVVVGDSVTPVTETGQFSRTSALAWAILVDAAMLNERLQRDIKETATSKGKPIAGATGWYGFFQPNPTDDCKRAFREYVQLRWPIRVFALDPYTQDQNVADRLSTRRELQLALAVAFTQGALSSNRMLNYSRRLEAEYETIALNRTQVGFSHGENTFGWRFYPRFQSPDTASNLTTIVRDQLIGGPNRNQLLRQRRLEPGPRECVAIVMMPSFVPCVQLDTVSNWFALANPKRKVLDHSQAMQLSRTVQSLKVAGCDVNDPHRYREGELTRLQNRVGQLESRLPTQTALSSVPLANTLGGFEMFSNGTTDLAPELYGWYGTPGIDKGKTTTLFLVGDHFSVLRSHVLAGNKTATHKMISRQVMRVEVAAEALAFDEEFIRIHVATPYGVSRELTIPVIGPKKETPKPTAVVEGYTLSPNVIRASYVLVGTDDGKYRIKSTSVDAPVNGIQIAWNDNSGSVPSELQLKFVFSYLNKEHTLPCAVDEIKLSSTQKSFAVPRQALDGVIRDLANLVNTSGAFAGTAVPLDQIVKSVRVQITPKAGVHATQTVDTANQLEIQWTGSIEFCPAPVVAMPPPATPSDKK